MILLIIIIILLIIIFTIVVIFELKNKHDKNKKNNIEQDKTDIVTNNIEQDNIDIDTNKAKQELRNGIKIDIGEAKFGTYSINPGG